MIKKGTGYKPHKRNHKNCIGFYYCAILDKTFDIGAGALKPGKQGYLCPCGKHTKLSPFNHEVHYYDEDNIGIPDYEYDNDHCRLKRSSCDKKRTTCYYGNKVWHACQHKNDVIIDLGLDKLKESSWE